MNKKRLSVITVLLVVSLAAVSHAVTQAQGRPAGPMTQQQSFSDPEATDAHCGYTDETTAGPYYISGTAEMDNLNTQNAPGQPMQISGVVYDGSTGKPIPNAKIEVWHTDSSGVYHPQAQGDVSDFSASDINLRGTVAANNQGEYKFTSILPAIYENRRRHIHYYITAEGYLPLFTQTYWVNDPNTSTDNTDANTEACRILTFTDTADGGTEATFDIYLRPDPAYAATSEATIEPTVEATAVEFTRVNLNTATADEIMTIPGMTSRMVREFQEYRPYVSIVQFRREIGKYVSQDQVSAYEQSIFVPVSVDESDAETLKQLPGVDDQIAAALIAGRPYGSNDAFLNALASQVSAADAAAAVNYLVSD